MQSNQKKEIIKIRVKKNKELETTEKTKKTKSQFFEGINKINNILDRLIKKKNERGQIINISSKRRDTTIGPTNIKIIIRKYEQFYANNFNNVDSMGKFLERHKFPE